MNIKTSWNRNITKAFTWRIIATLTTVVIAFLITGSIDLAIEIGFLEFFIKIAVYSFHEKFWSNIKFGIKLEKVS